MTKRTDTQIYALIGGVQYQDNHNSDYLLEREWAKHANSWRGRLLRKPLDRWYDAGQRDNYKHFYNVMDHIFSNRALCAVEKIILMGNITPHISREGFDGSLVYGMSREFDRKAGEDFPTLWQKRTAILGNRDGWPHHMDYPELQPSVISFERFEQDWGGLTKVMKVRGWTIVGLSANLFLLTKPHYPHIWPAALFKLIAKHIREVREAMESARKGKLILVVSEPEVFAALTDPHFIPKHKEDLTAITNCLGKLHCTFYSHLERAHHVKYYRALGLVPNGWPLRLACESVRLLWTNPKAGSVAYHHLRLCSLAARQWKRMRPILVPAPLEGYVSLHWRAGNLRIQRHTKTKDSFESQEIYPPARDCKYE